MSLKKVFSFAISVIVVSVWTQVHAQPVSEDIFSGQNPRDAARLKANHDFFEAVEKAKALPDPKQADELMIEAIQKRNEVMDAMRSAADRSKKSYFQTFLESLKKRGEPLLFRADPGQKEAILRFLMDNVTSTGMPLSFRVPKGYWKSIGSRPNRVDEIVERLLAGEEGQEFAGALNLYDGGLWQIAMAMGGHMDKADGQTRLLLAGRSGGLREIRAWEPPYLYGEEKAVMDKTHGFFFRMITDTFEMIDPLDGKDTFRDFPTSPKIHHADWKPILGENVWAAVIAPLQTAFLKHGENIPLNAEELALARNLLPAIKAMQSSIGAVYHDPHGTHGKHPRDISNENNTSLYAGLKMLLKALEPYTKDPAVAADIRTIQEILYGVDEKGQKIRESMEDYFKKYAFNAKEGVFYQGGFWIGGRFWPSHDFAVDCQTWGIIALGPEWVNRELGGGDEMTAYRIWENTKKRAGYFIGDTLRGVGFTDDHDILSSEWTFGAVLMTKEMAHYYEALYRKTGNKRYQRLAERLWSDGLTMRQGIEALKVTFSDGSQAYRYSNKRYYIVFGWWANPVPTLTSAWALMLDQPDPHHYFNPFVLGGGRYFQKPSNP